MYLYGLEKKNEKRIGINFILNKFLVLLLIRKRKKKNKG